ncbi:unnamed protein product [Clonostachys chloroleuca]|uniref:Zn(2)-C6 fungal-type domain-containing protein n=1 Tax=Clonostachys chloroleuca TaxID=1926264 RepID=A0AA35VLP2_9HYPO|nr:unnamed protein product [Clonostachys chloroleuca]
MPQQGAAEISRPKRRAIRACRFCRTRKIKCSGEEPECVNCRTYGKNCVYEGVNAEAVAAPRRRRRRQNSLLEQTEGHPSSRPRRSLMPYADTSSVSPDTAPGSATPQSNQRLSRMLVSANGVPSYHGRTSALFEEVASDWPMAGSDKPQMPEEWVEKSLVTKATKQRQLEEVNYHGGKLDFDGVDPELGMHLLSLHWNRQHHSFLLTYRPAFMRDMSCNGPYFSKLLLNAIYFGASKFSPRREVRKDPDDVRTAGWKFRQRVRELLVESLDRSDITTIQALLVMTNSLFALGDERSAAWLYAGIAFRMIVDLGMHVEPSDLANTLSNDDEDLEIRRRVFWGAFVVDKIQSLYQGRPVTLKESDTLVPIKFLDTYEELEYWKPFAFPSQSHSYKGSPTYSISTFTALCRLSIIMSDILSLIYTERSSDKAAEDLLEMQKSLHIRLLTWKNSLASHLVWDSSGDGDVPPPNIFSLHAMFNVLLILLHRPFVVDGHLLNIPRSVSVDALKICATAATEIVRLIRKYHQAFSVRRAPYLISYATYVAATVHVRIASKRSTDSDAYSNLESCLAVFIENQETNWAVRRAAGVVQNLMRRFGVSLPHDHKPLVNPEAITSEATTGMQSEGADGRGGSPDPSSSESPDIDGIIQSFGPNNLLSQGYNQMYEPQAMAHSQSTGLPLTGGADPATRSQFHPGLNGQMGFSDGLGLVEDAEPGYGGGVPMDDLLFGFNGSALDNYPLWQWDGQ